MQAGPPSAPRRREQGGRGVSYAGLSLPGALARSRHPGAVTQAEGRWEAHVALGGRPGSSELMGGNRRWKKWGATPEGTACSRFRASQTAETMKAPHVLDPRLLIGGCSPRGRHAFPVVLCPNNKEAGTRHPLKRGSDSPCGAGRMGQRRARLSSGTNGTGHQGAASAHRLPALSLQRDGSPADLPAGSGQQGLAWALLF